MLTIDGSYMEGGGQIVRTALALSALTRTPFKIDKIRHNRPVPGLKRQHLTCVAALQQLTDARVKGAKAGARSLEFHPGPVRARSLFLDIGSAGSITLLMQSLLLPVMFADENTELTIQGGTDVRWSIPIDYFIHIILPHFRALAAVDVTGVRRGFYPKGQGRFSLRIRPKFHRGHETGGAALHRRLRAELAPIALIDRPKLCRIQGVSAAADLLMRSDVARRQADGAKKRFGDRCPIQIATQYEETASAGTVITLWGVPAQGKVTLGADALGKKGVRAEDIGEKAANRLTARLDSEAALDHHLADNLIPLLALVGGILKPDRITGHILSNIYVCEAFLGVHFDVDPTKCLIRLPRET
jgi:RNA 3'-terminal phosphate cyclase (GTP)